MVTRRLVLLVAVAGAEPNAECQALGFASTLLCSTCDKLASYTESNALLSECRGCCTEDVSGTSGKYAQATLDICR